MIIVVGGSSGIGKAIIKEYQKKERTICIARTLNDDASLSISCDVTNTVQVIKAFEDLRKETFKNNFQNPILVCCNGFVEPEDFKNMTIENWEKTVQTNLLGTVRVIREFLKYAEGGKIIIFSSTAGTRPSPKWSAYAATKAALINLALTLSEELKSNYLVYCVSPGRVATLLRKKIAPEEDSTKIMQPNELVEVIKTLIKDKGLLDGQNIIIRKRQ